MKSDAFFDVIKFSKPEDFIEAIRSLAGDEFTSYKDEKTLHKEEQVHDELETATLEERESIFQDLFPKRRSIKSGVRFA